MAPCMDTSKLTAMSPALSVVWSLRLLPWSPLSLPWSPWSLPIQERRHLKLLPVTRVLTARLILGIVLQVIMLPLSPFLFIYPKEPFEAVDEEVMVDVPAGESSAEVSFNF